MGSFDYAQDDRKKKLRMTRGGKKHLEGKWAFKIVHHFINYDTYVILFHFT
jgi:hypothetical protein